MVHCVFFYFMRPQKRSYVAETPKYTTNMSEEIGSFTPFKLLSQDEFVFLKFMSQDDRVFNAVLVTVSEQSFSF